MEPPHPADDPTHDRPRRPPHDPGAVEPRPPVRPRRRRTVLATASLTASATVIAVNLALSAPASADGTQVVGSPWGDARVVDVTPTDEPVADPRP